MARSAKFTKRLSLFTATVAIGALVMSGCAQTSDDKTSE